MMTGKQIISRMFHFGLAAVAFVSLWSWPVPPAAANQGVGYVDAIGHGVARPEGTPRHQELSARGAAKRAAHIQLMNKLKRLKGSGISEYARADYRFDLAAGQSRGLVPNAFVVRETVTFRSDPHSGRLMVPVARVLVRYCLDNVSSGCRGEAVPVRTAALPGRYERHGDPSYPKARPAPPPAVTHSRDLPPRHGPGAAAIIIDLNGTPYLPVTDPVLIDTNGKRVFDNSNPAGTAYRVLYADTVNAAQDLPGVGSGPVVVRAIEVRSDNRIVISNTEARRIRRHFGAGDGDRYAAALLVITKD